MEIDLCLLTVFFLCVHVTASKTKHAGLREEHQYCFNQFGDPQYRRVVLHSDIFIERIGKFSS